MKRLYILITLSISLNFLSAQNLPLAIAHSRSTGIFDDGGAEIAVYDATTKYVFSTNASLNRVEVYDYKNVYQPKFVRNIDVSPFINTVTSVDVHFGVVAVVGYFHPQSLGKLLFFDSKGVLIGQYATGNHPDMVAFSPDGIHVLVANEGEPSDDYTIDPKGSISILNISAGIPATPPSAIKTIGFEKLDTTSYDPLIRVFGNHNAATPSEDLEPEYISFNSTSTKAYVSLQENNAVAIIDVYTATLDTVVGLGYKDFSQVGLDASDFNSAINIQPYHNLFGLYQPDGLAGFSINGVNYFASANEGDARDYNAYSEVAHLSDFLLNPDSFPNFASLYGDSVLGRLKLTNTMGNFNNDFFQDSLFTFGGRSFSIWDENGQLIWDSGDDFEQIISQLHPSQFNSNNDDNNSYKNRSDDKGPEPEGIAVGVVDGKTYAFIGLERMGGIMIYDVSIPTNPTFVMYELNRDFSKAANDPGAGDLGPESIEFIPANISPNGLNLLLVANEISGTITVYEMGIGVGLDEGYPLNEQSIFPNPSEGIFHTSQDGDFKVYNTAGQLIKTVKNYNRIDLSNHPDGIYIIKDQDGFARRVLKK